MFTLLKCREGAPAALFFHPCRDGATCRASGLGPPLHERGAGGDRGPRRRKRERLSEGAVRADQADADRAPYRSDALPDTDGDIETPLAEAPFEEMVGEAYWREVGGWEIWFEVKAAGRGSTAAQLRPATPGAREGFLEVHLCGAMRTPTGWSPSGRFSTERPSGEDAG